MCMGTCTFEQSGQRPNAGSCIHGYAWRIIRVHMQKHLDIKPVTRPQTTSKARRAWSKRQKSIAGVVAAVLLLLVVLAAWRSVSQMQDVYVDRGVHQAVYLEGGQVYFGKLHTVKDGYRLTDVYYPQSQTTAELQGDEETPQRTDTGGAPQLVKFGGELLGPQDSIILSSTQVQYWVNLRSDGKVMQAINDYVRK